jgi:hypothetical protein
MPTDDDKKSQILQDRPPVFRTWAGVYALVLGVLGFLTLLFHLFTRHYR